LAFALCEVDPAVMAGLPAPVHSLQVYGRLHILLHIMSWYYADVMLICPGFPLGYCRQRRLFYSSPGEKIEPCPGSLTVNLELRPCPGPLFVKLKHQPCLGSLPVKLTTAMPRIVLFKI
jgi:hypothetical protein